MKIVSACLAGINCNYEGGSKPCKKVEDLVARGEAIPVCPEQLGGLTTPREAAEQKGDKVVTCSGEDVTAQFEKGADEVLRVCRKFGCTEAVLKARSPSCGSGEVYDGTFSKTLTKGDGVCASLLKKNSITVLSEDDL